MSPNQASLLVLIVPFLSLLQATSLQPLLFSQPGPALSAPLTPLSLPTAVLLLLLFLNPTSSPLPVSMLPPSSSQASSIPFLPSSSLHLSFCSRGDMTSRASESQTYTKSYLQASEGCVHSEVQAPPPP